MGFERVSLVAILPDGTEQFEDVIPLKGSRLHHTEYQSFAERAVSKAGLTTSRSNPTAVEVRVHQVTLQKGQAIRSPGSVLKVIPPLDRMTDVEFNEEMVALLRQLPEEFWPFIRGWSDDHGHSSGMEEVVSIAEDLVANLRPAIFKFTQRLTAELKG